MLSKPARGELLAVGAEGDAVDEGGVAVQFGGRRSVHGGAGDEEDDGGRIRFMERPGERVSSVTLGGPSAVPGRSRAAKYFP